jgi:hypothetical protein
MTGPMNSAPPAPRNAGRLAAFAVAAFAIVVLAALVTQIVLLQAQLRTVREQRAIAERQSREALPLLRAARPLADDLHAAAPDATALARRAAGLLRQATPLIRDLNAADAGQTLREVSRLTDALLRSEVAERRPCSTRAPLPRSCPSPPPPGLGICFVTSWPKEAVQGVLDLPDHIRPDVLLATRTCSRWRSPTRSTSSG